MDQNPYAAPEPLPQASFKSPTEGGRITGWLFMAAVGLAFGVALIPPINRGPADSEGIGLRASLGGFAFMAIRLGWLLLRARLRSAVSPILPVVSDKSLVRLPGPKTALRG